MISIDKGRVLYWDKMNGQLWGTHLQYLPPTKENEMKVLMSRGKIPRYMLKLLEVPKDELEEFNNAKDDAALKELVIRDAKKHGCRLVSDGDQL